MSIHPSRKLYRLLWIIIGILVFILVTGTIAGITKKKTSPPPPPADLIHDAYTPQTKNALYGDLGQLRASTVDSPAVSIVIKPFLEYEAADTAFQEELVTKKDILRTAVLEWFSRQSAYRLGSEAPHVIKQQLMQHINTHLTLGYIQNIYFEEFAILY